MTRLLTISLLALALLLAGCASSKRVDTITLYTCGTVMSTYTAWDADVYQRDTYIVFTTTTGATVTWTGPYRVEAAPAP